MASIARSSILRQSPSILFKGTVRPAMFRSNFNTARATFFHSSSRRNILPPPPQRIEGTVNDPAPVPAPSPTHGSYHWTFDRLLAAGLVPLTLAPLAFGSLSPIVDAVLCAGLLIHSHTGFQNIIIDYIPKKRMPNVRRAFMWALNAATAVVGLALYEFETNDVGLTETIKRAWKA